MSNIYIKDYFELEGGKEYEISDEVKINFNIMSINGLIKCFNIYLENFNEEPVVYGNYIRYILYCNFIKKIQKIENRKILPTICNILKYLPLIYITYFFSNSSVFRLILGNSSDGNLSKSLIKNNDFNVIQYIYPFLNKYCIDYTYLLIYIIKNNRDDIFYIINFLQKKIIPSDDIINYLNNKHLFVDNYNYISYKYINTITIKNGISEHQRRSLWDIYNDKITIDSVDNINNHYEKNGLFLIKKAYKFIIYEKITTDKTMVYLSYYNYVYEDVQVRKIETIIY